MTCLQTCNNFIRDSHTRLEGVSILFVYIDQYRNIRYFTISPRFPIFFDILATDVIP